MKTMLFDIKQINEFFNCATEDIEHMIETFTEQFEKNQMWTTKQMLEIVEMTLSKHMKDFEEKFLEHDLYFNNI